MRNKLLSLPEWPNDSVLLKSSVPSFRVVRYQRRSPFFGADKILIEMVEENSGQTHEIAWLCVETKQAPAANNSYTTLLQRGLEVCV